jgi:hypothetical protein
MKTSVLKYPRIGSAWNIGAWCKGSTPVFGTVDPGSNPGAPSFYLLAALRSWLNAQSLFFKYSGVRLKWKLL